MQIVSTVKPWMPESMVKLVSGKTIHVNFSRAERKVYRKRKPMKPSEWAERYRVLTMSSLPGKWRNDTTPYLTGIMDASFLSFVREITVCATPQTGKSEIVNNCLGYGEDNHPGPALCVYPDETTAKENCSDRIGPMFAESKHLAELLTGKEDDKSSLRIKLISAPIYMAWATSVSRLANKPCKYVVFDETDKYPTTNKKEADPIRLGEARTTTFPWSSKIWKISTPSIESGQIWQSLLNSQVIFDYEVPCPLCGSVQVMKFGDDKKSGGIKWPEECRNADQIELEKLAWYECEHCQGKWTDFLRDKAVLDGRWISRHSGEEIFSYLYKFRPQKIGFHVRSWLSKFVSLSKIAAAWLRCKPDGKNLDLNAFKDFCNRYKAEPWKHIQQDRKTDNILKLRDNRPAGIVPDVKNISCLIASADTQDNGFWYEIRAFGYGQILNSWGIRNGFVDTFDALEDVLFNHAYRDQHGNQLVVQRALIDAMGHKTSEVYDFCRKHRGRIFPIKGEENMATPHAWSNIDFYPGGKVPIQGGIKLLRINTTFFKNLLSNKLAIKLDDPGAWAFNQEYDESWAEQLCAEFINEKGKWECPDGIANHGWDVSVYMLANADELGVKFWPEPEEQQFIQQANDYYSQPRQQQTSRW